ncbi:MAG: hypothetical protein KGZ62_03425 [Sulfurimonas sp.]|nr:hypothetical protein [Sulfurimonas sp.]
MTILEIENNLNTLVANFDKKTFIFDLLLAYGTPKSTIKRVQGSDHDRLEAEGELVLGKKLFFKVADENLHVTIDALKTQKEEITKLVFDVLDEREKHSQKTLAQLYDPNKMPEGLQKAHHNLDMAIEQCYRPKPFESDEERLEYLFKMYEEMTSK